MDNALHAFNTQLWEVRRLQFYNEPANARQLLDRVAASCSNPQVAEVIARVLQLEMDRLYPGALVLLEQSQQLLLPAMPGMYWYTRGILLHILLRFDDALASYQQARVYADQVDMRACWYFAGQAYQNKESLGEAIESYQKALDERGYLNDGDIFLSIGLAYDHRFKTLHTDMPDLIKWKIGPTVIDEARQLSEDAIAAYRQALASPGFTNRRDTLYSLGVLFEHLKDDENATECLLEICPPDIKASLASVKKDRRNPVIFSPVSQPSTTITDVLAASGLAHLAFLYARQGKWHNAIALYAVLTAYPLLIDAAYVFEKLLELCRQEELADILLQRYQRSLRNPPDTFCTAEWQFAGMILAANEEYEDALACYERVLADPAWQARGLTRHYQGDACAELDDAPRAIACYHYALLDRRYRAAHNLIWNNLALAYGELGRKREAGRCRRHMRPETLSVR